MGTTTKEVKQEMKEYFKMKRSRAIQAGEPTMFILVLHDDLQGESIFALTLERARQMNPDITTGTTEDDLLRLNKIASMLFGGKTWVIDFAGGVFETLEHTPFELAWADMERYREIESGECA